MSEDIFIASLLQEYNYKLQNDLRWSNGNWVSLCPKSEIKNMDLNKIVEKISKFASYNAKCEDNEIFIQARNNPLVSSDSIVTPYQPLVWVDLEMTGLNEEVDQIIEVAIIVSNGTLTQFIEGPEIVIKAPDSLLDNMNDWCKKHHSESGLTEAVRKSTVSLKEAEDIILKFLMDTCKIYKRGACLAGNSVHVDRRFISKQMKRLDEFLHYRIVDVSSIKELLSRWCFNQSTYFMPKKESHRALDDIKESINELCFFRATAFVPQLR